MGNLIPQTLYDKIKRKWLMEHPPLTVSPDISVAGDTFAPLQHHGQHQHQLSHHHSQVQQQQQHHHSQVQQQHHQQQRDHFVPTGNINPPNTMNAQRQPFSILIPSHYPMSLILTPSLSSHPLF